jgi:hypothetical protein
VNKKCSQISQETNKGSNASKKGHYNILITTSNGHLINKKWEEGRGIGQL